MFDGKALFNNDFSELIINKGWKLGLREYFYQQNPQTVEDCVRYYDEVSNGAWEKFLDTSNNKKILSIETGLGGSSIALARNDSEVYCLHYNQDLAKCIIKRAEEYQRNNIYVSTLQNGFRLPFKEKSFDLIILHKIDDILKFFFQSSVYQENIEILINEINKMLKENGILYVSGKKMSIFDYLRNKKQPSFKKLIEGKLEKNGLHCKKVLVHIPNFEEVYFIKDYLSNASILKLIWNKIDFIRRDNFALILNKKEEKEYDCLNSRLIEEVRIKTREKKLTFKKLEICSLNSIILHTEKFIIRVPYDENAYKRCNNNFNSLKKLDGVNLSFQVPKAVFEGKIKEQPYFVETRLMGSTPKYQNENFSLSKMKRIKDVAFDKLIDLHKATLQEVVMDNLCFEKLFGNPIADLSKYLKQAELDVLRELKLYLYDQFINKKQVLVCAHGDYHFGNIICDKNNRIMGIIDWELSVNPGLPSIDLIRFLSFQEQIYSRKTAIECILKILADSKKHGAIFQEYNSKIGTNYNLLKIFGVMSMIYFISYAQKIEELKFNKLWYEDNISNILVSACKKIIP